MIFRFIFRLSRLGLSSLLNNSVPVLVWCGMTHRHLQAEALTRRYSEVRIAQLMH